MQTHTKHIQHMATEQDGESIAWKPKSYALNSQGQAVWAKELIKKVGLKGDESILDIGCGDGKITDYIATLTHGEVVGVDLSPEMIKYARESFQAPLFMQMDAQKLEFEERFDVVFSNAALHWVQDHEAVVQGVYRALKSGGKAILQMGGYGNAKDVFIALDQVMQNYSEYFERFESPYRFYSDNQYNAMLDGVGFSRYHAELIPKDMVHDGVDAFKGWLETTWFPYIQCIPKSKQSSFVDEWTRTYVERFAPDEFGRIHVAMIRLEVEAVKKP